MANWDTQEADIERRLMADPGFVQLWQAVMAADSPFARMKAIKLAQTYAVNKGLVPQDFKVNVGEPNSGQNNRLEVDHQNFAERHEKALLATAALAPLGIAAAPSLFATGAAANPGVYTAPAAVGSSAGSWLTPLLKAGATAAIPAVAKSMSGNGGGSAGAGPAGAAVDQLLPELVKRFQIQNARTEQAGPLYDAVLKMATGRLPIWTRG